MSHAAEQVSVCTAIKINLTNYKCKIERFYLLQNIGYAFQILKCYTTELVIISQSANEEIVPLQYEFCGLLFL